MEQLLEMLVDVVGSDLMPTGFIGPEIAAKGRYCLFDF